MAEHPIPADVADEYATRNLIKIEHTLSDVDLDRLGEPFKSAVLRYRAQRDARIRERYARERRIPRSF